MGKKVSVYAICKNEAGFARRFMESMREADEVVVLDTGSTDGSAEILRTLGAKVFEEKIEPWRFDAARNKALFHVSEDADICVCVDLDEVFRPGWRDALEREWRDATKRAWFRFVWSFTEDGKEGTVLMLDKIHARNGYYWKYPVHEVLKRTDGRYETKEEWICPKGVELMHFPDKTKSRAQYLPLLELAATENPSDARCIHYLGREYMYAGLWQKCIDTLRAHLLLPGNLWHEERCASSRYMARAYRMLGKTDMAERMYYAAIAEAPHLREAYFELSRLFKEEGKISGAKFMAECALNIKERPSSYMSEESAWNAEAEAFLNDLLSE